MISNGRVWLARPFGDCLRDIHYGYAKTCPKLVARNALIRVDAIVSNGQLIRLQCRPRALQWLVHFVGIGDSVGPATATESDLPQ
jgi:hypothetical protein